MKVLHEIKLNIWQKFNKEMTLTCFTIGYINLFVVFQKQLENSGVFKKEAFSDGPLASHTLFFYEKSTGTVHGRLVRIRPTLEF